MVTFLTDFFMFGKLFLLEVHLPRYAGIILIFLKVGPLGWVVTLPFIVWTLKRDV